MRTYLHELQYEQMTSRSMYERAGSRNSDSTLNSLTRNWKWKKRKSKNKDENENENENESRFKIENSHVKEIIRSAKRNSSTKIFFSKMIK